MSSITGWALTTRIRRELHKGKGAIKPYTVTLKVRFSTRTLASLAADADLFEQFTSALSARLLQAIRTYALTHDLPSRAEDIDQLPEEDRHA